MITVHTETFLHFTDGASSDKGYWSKVLQIGDEYYHFTANGRRLGPYREHVTPPLTERQAYAAHRRIVEEKLRKGYIVVEPDVLKQQRGAVPECYRALPLADGAGVFAANYEPEFKAERVYVFDD